LISKHLCCNHSNFEKIKFKKSTFYIKWTLQSKHLPMSQSIKKTMDMDFFLLRELEGMLSILNDP
jgi:hypothetical protein